MRASPARPLCSSHCLLLVYALSSSRKLGCTHARESPISAEQLGCALHARATRFTASQSLFVLITHKTYRLAFVETLLKFRYPRLARVHPRMAARFRLRPGFRTVCRRRAGRTGQVCHCKQLRVLRVFTSVCECLRVFASVCERVRVFASVCERVRAFASVCERARSRLVAFSRVWSRLVAFGRANFFFVFGHDWACSVVFCLHFSSFFVILRHSSSFFVILRHSSSQIGFFRVWRATGGCGRATAGFVYVQHNCTTRPGFLQFLEIPGYISEWGWASDLL